MKRIKICFVSREFAHLSMGKTGGIGVFLKKFTKQLKDHHFLITVFSFGENSIRFDDQGIRVVKIKDLTNINEFIKKPLRKYGVPGYLTIKKVLEFFNRLYISLFLSVFVKKHQFDIIEFHDYGGDAAYFMGKIPKVVRCHGTALTLHQFMGYYKRQSDVYYETMFFKRFHKHVVAVSQFSAEMTKTAFKLKTEPKVIYNGIKVAETIDEGFYFNEPTKPFSIFYVGSIRERKGIDIACIAFNAIVKKFPEATFHVMGNNNNDYWNQKALPILTENALKQTRYYGMIPNEEVESFLKMAHVVLFPSFGENFSVALLEVMGLGKLVVTSNIPSFREIIHHNENGFIAKNEEDYVTLISSIFNNEFDINYVAKNAYNTIKNQFNSDTLIVENINYYKSII